MYLIVYNQLVYMYEEYCVCMTVYKNTSQDDQVSQNAKLLFRRVCVSLDWGVAKQQYRLRCSTLPQEMKTMGFLYRGSCLYIFISKHFMEASQNPLTNLPFAMIVSLQMFLS